MFQRLINLVVGDLQGCAVYLDDVVVYIDDWESHLHRIRFLFDSLFAKATVIYLGRVAGHAKSEQCRPRCWLCSSILRPRLRKS